MNRRFGMTILAAGAVLLTTSCDDAVVTELEPELPTDPTELTAKEQAQLEDLQELVRVLRANGPEAKPGPEVKALIERVRTRFDLSPPEMPTWNEDGDRRSYASISEMVEDTRTGGPAAAPAGIEREEPTRLEVAPDICGETGLPDCGPDTGLFKSLKQAVALAIPGDEIMVHQGVYGPGEPQTGSPAGSPAGATAGGSVVDRKSVV